MAHRRSRGALEQAVLRVLWDEGGPMSARQIRDRIAGDPAAAGGAASGVPALTTVLTVLDRLRAKHLVTKDAAAGGFVFATVSSESGFAADAMVTALLAATDRDAALLRFARRLDGRDLEVLRQALDGAPGDGIEGR
jgi:predicted transcriptional regulator